MNHLFTEVESILKGKDGERRADDNSGDPDRLLREFRVDMKSEAVLETMVQQCGKVGKTRFFYVDSTRTRNGTVS